MTADQIYWKYHGAWQRSLQVSSEEVKIAAND